MIETSQIIEEIRERGSVKGPGKPPGQSSGKEIGMQQLPVSMNKQGVQIPQAKEKSRDCNPPPSTAGRIPGPDEPHTEIDHGDEKDDMGELMGIEPFLASVCLSG
jgi:hypothetical protein